MTDTTMTPEVDNTVPEDLNDFKDLLFNGKTPVKEDIGESVDTPAPENTDEEIADTSKDDKAPDTEKPKKQTLQERIDEITAKRREAERVADEKARENLALLERIKQLEAGTTKPTTPKETATAGPSPDDTNEDGSEKYPLGEFDPAYLVDLTRHEFNRLVAEQKSKDEQTVAKTAEQQAVETLVTEWNTKLNEAKETKYPDFEEKAANIQIEFADLDPNYGDYLATTIMSLENGTDVLYYLAENIDEAKAIAKSGGVAATVALGRLSARLETPKETKPTVKTTKAPEPPPIINKGASSSDVIRGDTEDLEAFKRLLWPKQKGR